MGFLAYGENMPAKAGRGRKALINSGSSRLYKSLAKSIELDISTI